MARGFLSRRAHGLTWVSEEFVFLVLAEVFFLRDLVHLLHLFPVCIRQVAVAENIPKTIISKDEGLRELACVIDADLALFPASLRVDLVDRFGSECAHVLARFG